MGNAGSMDQHTDLRGHNMPLKLPMPEPGELEERFGIVLNSMNLPPDKARLLRQYDNEKKWELICDQERFQVKNPPHTYLQKLRGYLDPAVTRKKFRRRVQESTQVLRELEISLRTNYIGWVREFLNEENKGLDVLVEYLSFAQYAVNYDGDCVENSMDAAMDKSKPWSRSIEDLNKGSTLPSTITGNSITRAGRHSTIRSNTLPSRRTLKNSRLICKKDDVHVCIMCLRAIMNYQYGFNMVMSHPHAVNEIALSLNNKNPRTKALVLELLAAVCLVRGGHEIILSAFDNFKEVCMESQRFEKLMEYFKNEDNNIDFMVACMQFINIVVHSVEDMNFRVHLQYDFTKLCLDDYLDKLKHTESDKLQVQIQAYLDNVFDVGALLEDAETKNAALERVEELEENLSHMTEKLQDTENEAMAKIVELEKHLMQRNKDLESIKEAYKDTTMTVHSLRQLLKEKDEAIQRQSKLEKKIHELEKQGTIKIHKKGDGDISILPSSPIWNTAKRSIIGHSSSRSSTSSSASSSPSSINYSNSSDSTKSQPHSANSTHETSDSEMEIEAEHYTNGVMEGSTARIMNGTYKHEEILQPDDNSICNGITGLSNGKQLSGGNQAATERMIQFGRELQALSEQLCHEYGTNSTHKKMLQDAFSLLAYSDPWNCPVGQQLDPTQRESLCSALNSAILESQNLPRQPPLMLALGQATECVQLMARVRSGSCSFARVDDFLP
uniref:Formin-like 2a n=1 Tax=Nothobranchius pienaari TaxID=704102 RepID=A0A1A8NJ41_9TELE